MKRMHWKPKNRLWADPQEGPVAGRSSSRLPELENRTKPTSKVCPAWEAPQGKKKKKTRQWGSQSSFSSKAVALSVLRRWP